MILQSAVPLFPECIDSRMLQMEVEFFQLTKHEADELIISFYHWCNSILEDRSIAKWCFSGKNVQSNKIPELIEKNKVYDIYADGDILSHIVFNKKSFKQFDKKILYDLSYSTKTSDISIDYWENYEKYFRPAPQSEDEWKSALIGLFSEPYKICRSPIFRHDYSLIATICPYYAFPDLYHGQIRFCILVACISDTASWFSEQMIQFLENSTLKNINARITLSPIPTPASCSSHMTYFGANVTQNSSSSHDGYTVNEWYKYSFICGAEWYNIVSPLAQEHIPNAMENALLFPELFVNKLSNGAMVAKIKKSIMEIDTKDLLFPKLLLYDALYPGMMRIAKKHVLAREATGLIAKPRKRWELLPILEGEIIITQDHIIFQHINRSQSGI